VGADHQRPRPGTGQGDDHVRAGAIAAAEGAQLGLDTHGLERREQRLPSPAAAFAAGNRLERRGQPPRVLRVRLSGGESRPEHEETRRRAPGCFMRAM
jgi:hypothetical protein